MVNSDGSTEPTCPVRSELRHAGIYSIDVDRLAAFYGRMLGLVITDRGVMSTGADILFMTANAEQHHQLVLIGGRAPDTPSTVNQLSFRVDDLAALQTYARFLAGFPEISPRQMSHGNAWSIYFADPEGNGIEVYCDTPWYVSQPMRVPLDFADSDETLMRRIEEHARSLPGFEPRSAWQARMAQRMGIS